MEVLLEPKNSTSLNRIEMLQHLKSSDIPDLNSLETILNQLYKAGDELLSRLYTTKPYLKCKLSYYLVKSLYEETSFAYDDSLKKKKIQDMSRLSELLSNAFQTVFPSDEREISTNPYLN